MEAIRQGDIPGVQLRRRARVAGRSAEEIWPWIVEPENLKRWLADRIRVEPGPPGVLHLETDEPSGRMRREYAEIFEESRPHRLVLGFRELDAGWTSATALTLELSAVGADCEVMVFQAGFEKLPLSLGLTAWERARSRWAAALERLTHLVGAPAPPPGDRGHARPATLDGSRRAKPRDPREPIG